MSAWIHAHLRYCSQIQLRFFHFDESAKGLCDGWRMRHALTCHVNPACFHSVALSFWPLPVWSALSRPCLTSMFSTPALLFLVCMYGLSLPSHFPLSYISFFRHSSWPICMHTLVLIMQEYSIKSTIPPSWCKMWDWFAFNTRALGCHLTRRKGITWRLPEVMCRVKRQNPGLIHPQRQLPYINLPERQELFPLTSLPLFLSGANFSASASAFIFLILNSSNGEKFNQQEPHLRNFWWINI